MQHVFRISISAEHPVLKQHNVNNHSVLPGVASLKIAYDFSRKVAPFAELNYIEEVFWLSPIISYGNDVEVLLFLIEDNLKDKIRIKYSFTDYYGQVYTSGIIKSDIENQNDSSLITKDLIRTLLNDRSLKVITHNEAYEEFSKIGITYGHFFRSLSNIRVKDNCGIAEIACKSSSLEFINLLDSSFQSGMAISIGNNTQNLMPISLGKLIFHKNLDIAKNGTYTVFTEKMNAFRTNMAIFDTNINSFISIFDLGIRSGFK